MSELHGNIGPTRNYENLTNLPSINDVRVVGNLTPSDLGLADDASVEEIRSALENKVDKVTGKGLSENDYTDGEKAKLEGIEAGAEKNVQSDWDASDGSDAFIKNKPSVLETVTIRGTATTKSGTNTDLDVYKTAEVDSAIDTLDNKIDTNVADLDERKAEIDGYYETFTSGQTNQLIATEAVTDTEPYIYRKTGGSNDVGDRVYDTLVGGSVVWNQLIKKSSSPSSNGINFTDLGNGIIELNGTATAGYSYTHATITLQANHKYLLAYDKIANPDSLTFSMSLVNASSSYSFTDSGRKIISLPTDKTTGVGITFASGAGTVFSGVKIRYQVIDLTASVTPMIADYIYTLETANAGDGVAWFKKYFPGVYYGYAEPHFEHVKVSAKNTVGFNQWDEEWEVGSYNVTTGGVWNTTDRIRSKPSNYIDVLPNTVYCIYSEEWGSGAGKYFGVLFYDGEKTFLSYADVNNGLTFTTPSNARYVRFSAQPSYGTTYKNDICLNLHGDRDGEYEAYKKRTYPLDSSLTLRGIPKLDSANRLYFDGDIYEHDGSGQQRYFEVDLGTLNWTVYSADRRIYRAVVANLKTFYASQIANIMTPKYKPVSGLANWQNGDIATTSSNPGYIFICDTAYADAASFKTAMSGQMLVYEANTPVPFTAEPFQSPMVVDPLGTEEFVDCGVEEGTRDVAIPVGHTSEYPADLRGKLQRLPSPTGTNGDYIVTEIDGKLYLKPYVPAVGLTAPTNEGEGE